MYISVQILIGVKPNLENYENFVLSRFERYLYNKISMHYTLNIYSVRTIVFCFLRIIERKRKAYEIVGKKFEWTNNNANIRTTFYDLNHRNQKFYGILTNLVRVGSTHWEVKLFQHEFFSLARTRTWCLYLKKPSDDSLELIHSGKSDGLLIVQLMRLSGPEIFSKLSASSSWKG